MRQAYVRTSQKLLLITAVGFVAAAAMGAESSPHVKDAQGTMQLVGLKEWVRPDYPMTREYRLSPEIYAVLGLPAEPTKVELRQALEAAGLPQKRDGVLIVPRSRRLIFRGLREELDQVEAILLPLGKGDHPCGGVKAQSPHGRYRKCGGAERLPNLSS